VRYRTLAVLPTVFGLLFVIAASVAPSPLLYRVVIELVKVLALLGCFAAALAFERGDYLRRAWAFNGLCLLLLLTRDATLVLTQSPQLINMQSALVIAANLSSILGTFLMARAWHVAGLDLMESESKRRAFVLVGVIVALAVGGGALIADIRTRALVPLASDLGDVVSLCLIAPIAMTALAMRGGVLRWPWGLFTVSLVCWLFYDATYVLRAYISPATGQLINELFRTLACTYLCAAGLAQRRAVLAPDGD
jgi:hypothetical protein